MLIPNGYMKNAVFSMIRCGRNSGGAVTTETYITRNVSAGRCLRPALTEDITTRSKSPPKPHPA